MYSKITAISIIHFGFSFLAKKKRKKRWWWVQVWNQNKIIYCIYIFYLLSWNNNQLPSKYLAARWRRKPKDKYVYEMILGWKFVLASSIFFSVTVIKRVCKLVRFILSTVHGHLNSWTNWTLRNEVAFQSGMADWSLVFSFIFRQT